MNKIYSHNNPSKEWILHDIAKRAGSAPLHICDLACGSGSVWRDFLIDHPNITYHGADYDREAIELGQKKFVDVPNAHFVVADAQKMSDGVGTYDMLTAFSSLEHVVRIDKFLDTAFSMLKPGGIAYINYDDGHFTSRDIKERLMVPLSQILAKFGIEGPYMKRVKDFYVVRMLHERGARIIDIRKHNLASMKGFTKAYKTGLTHENVLHDWFAFENRLNEYCAPSQLSSIFGATVIIAEKL